MTKLRNYNVKLNLWHPIHRYEQVPQNLTNVIVFINCKSWETYSVCYIRVKFSDTHYRSTDSNARPYVEEYTHTTKLCVVRNI